MSKKEEQEITGRRRRTSKKSSNAKKSEPVKKAVEEQPKTPASTGRKRRYKGYDVEEVAKRHKEKEGSWFWKVFVLSIGISILILILIVIGLYVYSKKRTDYISGINEKNTLETVIEGQTNLQITETFAGTADGTDHTEIRLVRYDDDGELFSYFKTEGLVSDYKEVVANGQLYRNDGTYTYYYAMVDDDYDEQIATIESALFQVYDNEKIDTQNEASETVTITTTYEVQSGDKYTQIYGCSAGDEITREIIMDKETSRVSAAKETYNDEIIYTYSLELNAENKTPKFYKKLSKAESSRKCAVYYDYDGENEQSYSYDVPEDVYFAILNQDGYTVYMDKNKETEFTDYEMQMQSLDSVLTLYIVKDTED